MKITHIHLSKLAIATLLAIGANTANAAGFAIIENSVTGLGAAFSGGAAAAEDASTVYFNPAGMNFDHAEADFGVHIIAPNVNYDDRGSRHVTGGLLDVNNEDGGNAGVTAIVPNFYYTRPLNNKWVFGLGVNAPFGLATEYDNDWVGRYHALDSEIKTINLNPSLAYKVDDSLTLGFGISAQYVEARLTNAVDFGTILFLGGGPAGLIQNLDGEAEVEGNDISFGFNVGFLWQANNTTRVGAHYRSRIKHKLEGDAKFTTPAAAAGAAAALGLVNGNVEASITLPDSLSVSIHHQATPKLAIMGDITWTNWSVLDELRIEFDNPAAADSVVTTDWQDSNRYSLGLSYKYSDTWTWRAGVAYDEATNTTAREITPRVPDADRTWLTLGASYNKDNMRFDFGYAHLFVDDIRINKSLADTENQLRGNLNGDYKVDVNIISAQARWLF